MNETPNVNYEPPDRYTRQTVEQLIDGLFDTVASLSYRTECERELNQRGIKVRNDHDGRLLGELSILETVRAARATAPLGPVVSVTWEPTGPEDDLEERLTAKEIVAISGVNLHVEAYRVKYDGNIQVGDGPWAREAFEGAATISTPDGPYETFTWSNGRQYTVVATPHC